MKYRKTPWNDRSVFKYEFANGDVVVLRAGENGVTEAWIKFLHSGDDAEVYNNIQNSRPEPSDEEKAHRKEWEEKHPGEKADKNWNLSIDSFISDDTGAPTADRQEDLLDPRARLPYDEDEPADIERLHQIIEALPKKYQDTYDEVYRKENTNTKAGENLDVSEGAVRYRLNKIDKAIAADETLQKICRRGTKQDTSR